jgi:hypothetical protein
MTTAKNGTGIDGTLNACTNCTAAGANSTVTQAITLASAAKTFSVWIQRTIGTGTVEITLDNFATTTNVTSLITTGQFNLVQMTQTLANPTVGIRLVTSGDAIRVDVAQLEDIASFASTPIPTTTIAVTRNADVLTYPSAAWYNEVEGAFLASVLPFSPSAAAAANNRGILLASALAANLNDGVALAQQTTLGPRLLAGVAGVATAGILPAGTFSGSTFDRLAGAYKQDDFALSFNGGAVGTDTSGAMPTGITVLGIGSNWANVSNGDSLFGIISRVSYWRRRLPNSTLQAVSA